MTLNKNPQNIWLRLGRKSVLRRIFLERFTEPIHLNLMSLFVYCFGTTRAKISCDLIPRPQHAWGILWAADSAKRYGYKKITIIELGVAAGVGFLNLCDIARRVTSITGISINLVGVDGGKGLPIPKDYRDHPELYKQGGGTMDIDRLRKIIPQNASLIIGDVSETYKEVTKKISAESPLGFVCIDLDFYSSTSEALKIFLDDAEKYLPCLPCYVDDIFAPEHNQWCGEMFAINEFNKENDMRKFEHYKFLRAERIFKNARWLDQIYFLQVLDHRLRQS